MTSNRWPEGRSKVVPGLRAARSMLRDLRTELKGQNDPYAKGFRAALIEADGLFAKLIKQALAEAAEEPLSRGRLP